MSFPQRTRKTCKVIPDALSTTEVSEGSNTDNPEPVAANSRDALAETFIASGLQLQHSVPTALQRGLSMSFDLDAYLLQSQNKVDSLLQSVEKTTNVVARAEVMSRINAMFDEMCVAQERVNKQWDEVHQQVSDEVRETKTHWKRIKPFFPSKKKNRGEDNFILLGENDLDEEGVCVGRESSVAFPEKPKHGERQSKQLHCNNKGKEAPKSARKRRLDNMGGGGYWDKRSSEEMSSSGEDSSSDWTTEANGVQGMSHAAWDEKSGREKQEEEEPIYCLCRKVSYGPMVMCDKEACRMEWFHFGCVGLKTTPRGKWYCPKCRDGNNCKVTKNNRLNDKSETVREPAYKV